MKKFIKFIFASLFSNKNVLEGKKQKLWTALIVGFIAVIISVIPTTISFARKKGADIINSSTNYSLDTSLTLLSKKLGTEGITLKVDSEGNLQTTLVDEIIIKANEGSAQEKILLVVAYADTEEKADDLQSKYLEYKEVVTNQETGEKTYAPVSHMLFSQNKVIINLYADSTVNQYTSEGTLKSVGQVSSVYEGKINALKNVDFASFYDESLKASAKDECVKSWKSALNKMAKPINQTLTLAYTGIISCLNLGVILLVTLMLFLLTKLKSNQNEKLSFASSLKIACFASLCPALLTILLGSLIQYLSTIGFVLIFGLRSTLLGIKATSDPNATSSR